MMYESFLLRPQWKPFGVSPDVQGRLFTNTEREKSFCPWVIRFTLSRCKFETLGTPSRYITGELLEGLSWTHAGACLLGKPW